MSRAARLRVAGAVTIVLAVVIAAAVALRDAGATHPLLLWALVVGWFGGPALAVRVVRTFHANEFSGSSIPMVVAIVACVWIALMLWNAILAPLVGLTCAGTPRCSLGEAVASQLGQAAVIFLAAFGAASLVTFLRVREQRSAR
jgi:hypothetical protein